MPRPSSPSPRSARSHRSRTGTHPDGAGGAEHTHHPKLGSRFDEALAYASRAHWRQVRKATDVPYVAHLLAVASLVLEHGGGEDEAIAALLHDAVEDAGGAPRRDDVRARFGDDVVRIVDACSDHEGEPKPPWRERKLAHLARLANETDARVRLVVACDKLHNARSVLADYERHGAALWARFNGGREGTIWYYRSLADELVRGGPAALGAELEHLVDALEACVRAAESDLATWPPFRS